MNPLAQLSEPVVDSVNNAIAKLAGGSIGTETTIKLVHPHTQFAAPLQVSGHYAGATFCLEASNLPITQEELAPLTGDRPLSEIDPAAANLVLQLWLAQHISENANLTIDKVSFNSEETTSELPISIPFEVHYNNAKVLIRLHGSADLDLASLLDQYISTNTPPPPANVKVELDLALDVVSVDQQELRDLQVGDIIVLSRLADNSETPSPQSS